MNHKIFIISIYLCVIAFGCAHCSKTVTHFKGKTAGINPYGAGNVIIDRESYWGDMNCISRMLDKNE